MITLKEFIDISRKGIEVYESLAEINGQEGNHDLFEIMYEEKERLSDFCDDLEGEYDVHQSIGGIQLYNLLDKKEPDLREALRSVLESYFNELESKKEKLVKKQDNIRGIQGVIESFE